MKVSNKSKTLETPRIEHFLEKSTLHNINDTTSFDVEKRGLLTKFSTNRTNPDKSHDLESCIYPERGISSKGYQFDLAPVGTFEEPCHRVEAANDREFFYNSIGGNPIESGSKKLVKQIHDVLCQMFPTIQFKRTKCEIFFATGYGRHSLRAERIFELDYIIIQSFRTSSLDSIIYKFQTDCASAAIGKMIGKGVFNV